MSDTCKSCERVERIVVEMIRKLPGGGQLLMSELPGLLIEAQVCSLHARFLKRRERELRSKAARVLEKASNQKARK